MQIDRLTVALRARNAWESFDLGIALARHAGTSLFAAFILPFAGFALLVNLLAWGHPTIAMLIFWWSKPLFDRIALHVLAQAVFGATPGWRATLRSLRTVPRTGLAYALTLGRFDFARSFHLAVYQLEGQSGRARRDRIKVLDNKARGHAVWLTVVVIHFVYVLLFGLDGLLKMVSPEGMQFSLRLGDYFSFGADDPPLLSQYLFNLAIVLAECVLEPLYVAAGFSLYLNRRTALEGWDLEVAFKRMTARVQAAGTTPASRAAPVKAAVALLMALALHAGGGEAQAQTTSGAAVAAEAAAATAPAVAPPPVTAPEPASTNASRPPTAGPSVEKMAITTILKGPEFKQSEERKVWRPKGGGQAKDRAPPNLDGWVRIAQMMGELLRVVAWILAILFIGWLLYFLSQRMGWFRNLVGNRGALYKPDVLFGLDLRPESLPDDIAAAARARLAAGDTRAALSLLYRGALRVLVHQRDLDVREGDTEGDCVRRVNRALPGALAEYFGRLVEAWGLIAYARRNPAGALAQSLVDDWARHFTSPAAISGSTAGGTAA